MDPNRQFTGAPENVSVDKEKTALSTHETVPPQVAPPSAEVSVKNLLESQPPQVLSVPEVSQPTTSIAEPILEESGLVERKNKKIAVLMETSVGDPAAAAQLSEEISELQEG